MSSDTTKLKAVVYCIALVSLVIGFYLWYLTLKQINATEFIWFVFGFHIFFGLIFALLRGVIEDGKLKELEKRIKELETR